MQLLTGLFTQATGAPTNLLNRFSPPPAAGGLNLNSILQGTATVAGILSTISAGQQDAAAAELTARDSEREIPFESLQGLARRRDLRRAAAETIGDINVATAAGGVDASAGTPADERRRVFRELDLGLETDQSTQEIRQARLRERAGIYRLFGRQARLRSYYDAFGAGTRTALSLAGQANLI